MNSGHAKRIEKIEYPKKFLDSAGKLPSKIVSQAKEKERLFKENCFNSGLKTHKLHGKEKNVWAFWVNYEYRIKFVFLNDEEVLFLDIGKHNIYK